MIIEKPLCLNFNQLKKIYLLSKQNKNIKLTSNLVLRTNSLFKEFKKRINKQKIFYIEGDYIWGRKEKLFGWRSKIKEYSLTLGAGIHIIDLINWLTGLKPISVFALVNFFISFSKSEVYFPCVNQPLLIIFPTRLISCLEMLGIENLISFIIYK